MGVQLDAQTVQVFLLEFFEEVERFETVEDEERDVFLEEISHGSNLFVQ